MMAHTTMDRGRAARIASASQVALGVVVVLGITGAVVMGRGNVEAPHGPLTLVDLPPLASNQAGSGAFVPVDNEGIAARLGVVANAPQKPAPIAEVDPQATPTAPPAAETPNSIEYLGQVGLGKSKLALVRFNTAQRIVGVNDEIGPYKIVEITHTKLGIDESGTRTDIDLKAKSTDVVSRATGIPGNGANGGAAMGTASGSTAMRRAAEMARTARLNAAKNANGMKATVIANPRPNSPEGFEARYNAVMERLKTSGQFANEDDMSAAAKRLLEAEDGNK